MPAMTINTTDNVSKEKLLQFVKTLLSAGDDLDFLMQLEQRDLERLVVAIRARVGESGKSR
jgi:hypothetical protein